MPDLPKRKVGIVACSGEELAEGTVTRLAALKVLEELRPGETVTICLPLFLAGGEGDRAFAKFYPTIAVDGCDKRCAARATEMYSNKPAASLVVDDILARARPAGAAGTAPALRRRASRVVDALAERHRRRGGSPDGRALEPHAKARSWRREPAAQERVSDLGLRLRLGHPGDHRAGGRPCGANSWRWSRSWSWPTTRAVRGRWRAARRDPADGAGLQPRAGGRGRAVCRRRLTWPGAPTASSARDNSDG